MRLANYLIRIEVINLLIPWSRRVTLQQSVSSGSQSTQQRGKHALGQCRVHIYQAHEPQANVGAGGELDQTVK